MNYKLIDSVEALNSYCLAISQAKCLAIDTEFVRTRTLRPKLGLIQVYDGKQLGLIDPIAIDDLSAFVAILDNPAIIKLLHSCSEDLEVFWCHLGTIPKPIFDSQIAYHLIGNASSVGYANMIEQVLNTKLDKGESRTDWLARPLSDAQLVYAAADVFYLYQIFNHLYASIVEQKHLNIVYDEVALIAAKKQATLPDELAYLTIKNNWRLAGVNLHALKLLAQWRLQQARIRDKAINFVVREAPLIDIARILPDSKSALMQISTLGPQEGRKHADVLLSLVKRAKQAAPNDLPAQVLRLVDFSKYKQALAQLKIVCEKIASEQNLPHEIVASKKQLNQFLKWCWMPVDETEAMGLLPDILSAWRRELFRPHLLSLFNNQEGGYETRRSI